MKVLPPFHFFLWRVPKCSSIKSKISQHCFRRFQEYFSIFFFKISSLQGNKWSKLSCKWEINVSELGPLKCNKLFVYNYEIHNSREISHGSWKPNGEGPKLSERS